MADFDLTQTDQQVQNILNDGQSAMGAGAQTTLTTEYVMLKDTNGVYHKILKSSFTEAIRDVLAGLLVNNDKGTTISQIAAIASGDFGSVTPANLASVLGATRTGSISLTAGTPALLLSNVTSALIYVYETSNMGVCSLIMASVIGLKVVSEVPNNSPMGFTFNNTTRNIYVDMALTAGTQRTVNYKVLFLA